MFIEGHAFAHERLAVFGDGVARKRYQELIGATMLYWPSIAESVPSDWMFVDPEQSVVADFDFDQALQLLNKYRSARFWSIQ